jgi:hypothetical protein
MSMFCQIGPRIVLDRTEREASMTPAGEVAPRERPQSPTSPRPASVDALTAAPDVKADPGVDIAVAAQARAQW